MAQVLGIAVQKRIRNKIATRFGSYGWSGGAQRDFEKIVAPLKWQLSDPFEFIGAPTEEELKQGQAFGAAFARLVAESLPRSGRIEFKTHSLQKTDQRGPCGPRFHFVTSLVSPAMRAAH